jgi:Tfp pilus assembly protein PilE
MKSHLISQVVLKQFADDKRQIIVHTKGINDTELKPIDSVAYMDIDKTLIEKLEEQWSKEIEAKADKAINNLQAGNINYFEKHIDVIKSLMALHFIRSQAFRLVEANKQAIDNRLIQAKDGVLAVYPEYRDIIERVYTKKHQTAYVDVAIKVMEQYIPKVYGYISDSDIGFEIGEAPDGSEFVIGDIPVVTADKNSNFGIPITEANSIAMPLTPKHLVALKKNPDTKKYKKLTAEQVHTTNSRQLGLMQEHYYSTATYTST